MKENSVEQMVPHEICMGCYACQNICPVQAIHLLPGVLGHVFPKVNDNCIDCGKCIKICPALNVPQKNELGNVLASWCKSRDEHSSSASGGLASVIGREITSAGGCIYGCAFVPHTGINHIRIDNKNDVAMLKGSKYAQSNLTSIMKAVQADLIAEKKVVFVGTGCQVAGLKNFIGKSHPNLFTIGLVCHGVPSQKLLFDYLDVKGMMRQTLNRLSFRCQVPPYYVLEASTDKGNKYKRSFFNDIYYSAYLDSMSIRDSCTTCPFATRERVEDLTLGDFHKIDETIFKNNPPRGLVSLVIVNNEKGAQLLEDIKYKIYILSSTFDEAIQGNPHLVHPPHRRGNYPKFVKVCEKKGLTRAFYSTQKIRVIKNIILAILKKLKMI